MRLKRLMLLLALLMLGLLVVGTAAASNEEEEEEEEAEEAEPEDEFTADLSGDKEVPPADPDGTGEAEVELDAAAEEVCFEIEWDDIAAPTAGHIHQGEAGVNGSVVVDLLGQFSRDELEADDEVEGCTNADPELVRDIAENPEGFYVNVHNQRFPGGAIRGQLED